MPQSPHLKAGVDLERVRVAIAPALSAHGVALVELDFTHERVGWTLRITIERPDAWDASGPFLGAGVTLEDCANVSRDVSAALDGLADDPIPHAYHLEVGSPGLDRPLHAEADFQRFRGLLAKVKLARAASDGQRVLRGQLDEAPAGRVAVQVDGKRLEVPYADVLEAHLVYEPFAPPKGPPSKQAKGKQPKHAPASNAAKGAPKKSDRGPAGPRRIV